MKKVFIGMLFVLFLGACSSMQKVAHDEPQVLYKVVAIAETNVDKDGDTCADATGVIRVLHNKIIGSAIDTFGRSYDVSGRIDGERNVTGGFAVTVITAVDFDGIISDDREKANGKWEDLYKCKGNWTAMRIH